MLASTSSTHSSRSLKHGTLIMMNVLDALDQISRWDYRLNNCY